MRELYMKNGEVRANFPTTPIAPQRVERIRLRREWRDWASHLERVERNGRMHRHTTVPHFGPFRTLLRRLFRSSVPPSVSGRLIPAAYTSSHWSLSYSAPTCTKSLSLTPQHRLLHFLTGLRPRLQHHQPSQSGGTGAD